MSKRLKLLAGLAVVATIVCTGGCGEDSAGPNPPNQEPPPRQLGSFPPGVYQKTIDAADVPGGYASLAGIHQITFRADATFEFRLNGAMAVEGYISVTGSQVKIVDESGPLACLLAPGTYTWTVAGSELSFSLVSDPCGLRAIAITTKPYVLQ